MGRNALSLKRPCFLAKDSALEVFGGSLRLAKLHPLEGSEP